eukprot:48646_1
MSQRVYKCGYCHQPNPASRCSACKTMYYCNRKCQSSHWNKHRKVCKWEIAHIHVPIRADSEDEDQNEDGEEQAPAWHKHFEPDELLDRYQPIRSLGLFF